MSDTLGATGILFSLMGFAMFAAWSGYYIFINFGGLWLSISTFLTGVLFMGLALVNEVL